jgi:hypothetical protein
MKHAIIKLGEYNIPLIGIPASATEYECDLCHEIFSMEEVEMDKNGIQFLCKKCRYSLNG